MRKKNILGRILAFFGLLGFAMIYGAVIGIDINPAAYTKGVNLALIGLGILFLVVVGNFFYNRLPDRSLPIPWDKQWRRLRGFKF